MWKYEPLKINAQVPDLQNIKNTGAATGQECRYTSVHLYVRRTGFLLFFLFASWNSFCQEKYLVLDKPGRIKRIRYYTGDEIMFRLRGDKTTYSNIIQAIGDSTIKVRDTDVSIREIHSIIRYSDNGFLYQIARILPKAGMLYFLADTFNPIFRGEKPDISRSGVVVGSTLIATGYTIRLFRKRTLKINNYRTIKILQTF
jgi:hypothetical protein